MLNLVVYVPLGTEGLMHQTIFIWRHGINNDRGIMFVIINKKCYYLKSVTWIFCKIF
jgi:hypothetical protein